MAHRRFSKIFRIIRHVLFIAIIIFLANGLYRTIDATQDFERSAADLTLTPQTAASSRIQSVLNHELDTSYPLLAGSDYLNELIFTAPGSLSVTLDKRFRDVRLIVTNTTGAIVADTLLHPGQHTLNLQAGHYRLYAIGNGFSGTVHLQSESGHFADAAKN